MKGFEFDPLSLYGLKPISNDAPTTLVQSSYNRNLFYTKDEVNAQISSVVSANNLWQKVSSTYDYLNPITTSNHLLIGAIDTAGLALLENAGAARAIFVDDTTQGTAFFINHSAGDTPFPLGAYFVSARSRGTANVPVSINSGDFLGGLVSAGFDGTQYSFSGSSHLIPGVISVSTGTISSGVVERKVYIGSLTSSMIGWDSNTNDITINEAQLNANITAYYDLGIAFSIDGATGAFTIPVPGTGANAAANIDSAQTLTNKRVTKRVVTVNAPGATPTTVTDSGDIFEFTGLNTAITSMTTNLSGTPVNGDLIQFSFVDNGTPRAITWGTSFASGGLVSLPTTTVTSTVLRVVLQYQTIAALNKWVCVAVS